MDLHVLKVDNVLGLRLRHFGETELEERDMMNGGSWTDSTIFTTPQSSKKPQAFALISSSLYRKLRLCTLRKAHQQILSISSFLLLTTRGYVDFGVLCPVFFEDDTRVVDSTSATFALHGTRTFWSSYSFRLEYTSTRKNLSWNSQTSFLRRENGVHPPVAAPEAEGVQVLWYVSQCLNLCA
jgi:hypothetical protein